jgi:hypothetical protein
MQIQSKSLLAKLLSTENITVEVKADLPTAAFDPMSRTMYIPKWKDMPACMQDLFIGHEVGHVFDTPAEGWHDAVCEDRTLKGFLNVIEDARIERNVKSRYPGLVRSFYAGYRELFERDFFGVKDVDVNKLPLIDRINLHFKVGSFLNVQFATEEQSFVDRCANTQTWEEVEALARELHGKAQETAEEDVEKLMEDFDPQSGDSDMDMEGDMSSWEQSESEDTSEDEGGSAAGNTGEETDEDSDDSQAAGNSDSDDDASGDIEDEAEDEAPQAIQDFADDGGVGSITDKAFRENEESLLDTSESKESVYITLPTGPSLLDNIVQPKDVYRWDLVEAGHHNNYVDPKTHAEKLYKDFIAQNSKTINQMVASFEMKRKASQFIKAKTAKTGDLNEDRLWAYKTSDDLFKQVTSIPEGKNHGFIMYLDMSGSMFRNMGDTLAQLINLTMFARKINVPFEVYGFTTGNNWGGNLSRPESKVGEYVIEEAKTVKLLTSDFSKAQLEEAYKYLLLWKSSFDYRMASRNNRTTNGMLPVWMNQNGALDMGGTPLNATIVIGIEIAKRFRKGTGVEILNTIVLTDGEATDYSEYWKESEGRMWPQNPYYRQEPVFKYGSAVYPMLKGMAHRNVELTCTLLEIYKEITGSKVVNYHILDRFTKRTLEDCKEYATVGDINMGYWEWEKIFKPQQTSGLVEARDKTGFDVRYIMNGGKLSIEDETLEVKSTKKGDLLRGFRKFAGSKAQQRIFVQKFIPEIA